MNVGMSGQANTRLKQENIANAGVSKVTSNIEETKRTQHVGFTGFLQYFYV